MEIVIKFKNCILEFALITSFGLAIVSLFCGHPLTLCLTLILLAFTAGIFRGLIFIKWIFYAVILIFLGGIIVVFIYVTTLAGNEKFDMKLHQPLLLRLAVVFSLTYFFFPNLSQVKKEIFIGHTYFSSAVPLL
jgi:hypothetical protein